MTANTDAWIRTVDEIDSMLPLCARTLNEFFDPLVGFFHEYGNKKASAVSHALALELLPRLPDMGLDCQGPKRKDAVEYFKQDLKVWEGGLPADANRIVVSCYRACAAIAPLLEFEKPVQSQQVKVWIDYTWQLIDNAVKHVGGSNVQSGHEPAGIRHAMILYRIRRALHELRKLPSQDEKRTKDLYATLSTLDEIMLERSYFSIAMCSAIEHNEEDALQLGFLLYTLRKYSPDKLASDVLVEFALKQVATSLFGAEKVPKLEPVLSEIDYIFASPIGVLSLLAELPVCQLRFDELAPLYERAYRWIRRTQRELKSKDTPFWMAEPWRGATKPELWINAAAIQFLLNYREVLRDALDRQISSTLGARYVTPYLKNFVDHVLYGGLHATPGISEAVSRDVIKPATETGRGSTILVFGPAGCGKTELARCIAWELKWPLIEIGARELSVPGERAMAASLARISRQLCELDRKVVLVDELERALYMSGLDEDRMPDFIKTNLLPGIDQTRAAHRIILIISTSNPDLYRSSLTRPGRFDFVIPTGPPKPEQYEGIIGYPDQPSDTHRDIANGIKQTVVPNGQNEPLWYPTIGEICVVADLVVRQVSDVEASTEVERVAQELAEKVKTGSSVNSETYTKFEQARDELLYPPIAQEPQK